MDEIINSIRNGQRTQALEQLYESTYFLDDLFERLLEENMAKEIIVMYRVAVNLGYLTFSKD